MSLSSLRSFSGAASLATTAFDTARSTLKAMAEAAVPPPGPETTSSQTPGDRRRGAPTVVPAAPTGGRMETGKTKDEKRRAGVRKGTVLDAYA